MLKWISVLGDRRDYNFINRDDSKNQENLYNLVVTFLTTVVGNLDQDL